MTILELTGSLIEEVVLGSNSIRRSSRGGSSRRMRRPYKGPRPKGSIRAMMYTHNKNAAKARQLLQIKVQRKTASMKAKQKMEQVERS